MKEIRWICGFVICTLWVDGRFLCSHIGWSILWSTQIHSVNDIEILLKVSNDNVYRDQLAFKKVVGDFIFLESKAIKGEAANFQLFHLVAFFLSIISSKCNKVLGSDFWFHWNRLKQPYTTLLFQPNYIIIIW